VPPQPRKILLLGATGTIGRATAAALVAKGHDVTCLVRKVPANPLPDTRLHIGDVTDRATLTALLASQPFAAIVSCLASRTGAPRDAWNIDHDAHQTALAAARAAGVPQMVLLSAICVQKPRLAFQFAKLAFEKSLIASGLTWSIVRPTAYFKSLSGQIDRLRAGKPFLLFGNGTLTACKPIGDADLGRFLADCLDSPELQNRILPIGGPGPALTPRDQGEELFRLLGLEPRFRHVPLGLMDAIIATLSLLGPLSPNLRDKAELARIGRYYARESMLVLDPGTGRYDADATPSTGQDTLFDFYARVLRGEVRVERGDHAVF
jgi:divinyl chlorophyllide a 8-vinyl-reductase